MQASGSIIGDGWHVVRSSAQGRRRSRGPGLRVPPLRTLYQMAGGATEGVRADWQASRAHVIVVGGPVLGRLGRGESGGAMKGGCAFRKPRVVPHQPITRRPADCRWGLPRPPTQASLFCPILPIWPPARERGGHSFVVAFVFRLSAPIVPADQARQRPWRSACLAATARRWARNCLDSRRCKAAPFQAGFGASPGRR